MNESVRLFDLLGELARRRFQQGERAFASLGLNHTESRLLSLLRQAGGSAAQDVLTAQLAVDRTNGSRALQQLETLGYIQRRVVKEDRRAREVLLTQKGRNVATQIAKLRERMGLSFFASLSAEESTALRRLLEKVVRSP
jgi:MarR family transcriptional regulator, transcriptional regulator for hemolysin